MTRVVFTVEPDEEGLRLDRFCAARLPELSRTRVQALNAAGGITVDGGNRLDSYTLSAGEVVAVDAEQVAERAPGPPLAQSIPIQVAYADDAVVVVNKQAGLVVHPAHGNWDGTLVNALAGSGVTLAPLGSPDRPGVVHRLDKDTSGLMVLARTDAAYRALVDAFKAHAVGKTYHAIVHGNLSARSLTLEGTIARDAVHRQRMTVTKGAGRPARTDVLVVDTFSHFDYIRVHTRTGRTHQIRVHMAHAGNPLLGDAVYGGRRKRSYPGARVRTMVDNLVKLVPRHALHASQLSFDHPVTGLRMTFTCALPPDMRNALEILYREDRAKEAS